MRPIDADALMEKLNGIWDCNDMTFAPVDGCCIDADCKSCRWRETIEYVKRLVQNQPTASPWHRVDVEEPTKAGWYLVMDVDGDFNVDEWHNTFGWQFITPSDADRITHWMPIEPPKEDA